jgi:SPP1 family predicted phage head-tail adaptor
MGGPVVSVTNEQTMWAQVSPLNGQELIVAQQQQSLTTHKVIIRWVGNIKADDQISYARSLPDSTTETVVLNIENVIDLDENHRQLTLMCKVVQ